ncbi:hypothetical protein JGG83_23160, partial [Salmonella enterica subsp. enterica serovar Derby]|nr:hypothetical protein [Salmonella enterica subsp. enterica serovar Derby]
VNLLFLFNCVWCEHVFPDSWREAVILPFPQPGQDPTDPSNYRPIALTSCLCKLLERMVNARLMWFLETNGVLSPHQCGFRHHPLHGDNWFSSCLGSGAPTARAGPLTDHHLCPGLLASLSSYHL